MASEGFITLEEAQEWADRNNMDVLHGDVIVPCASTRAIASAIRSYNESAAIGEIRKAISPDQLAIIGKSSTPFAYKIIDAIKDRETPASEIKKMFFEDLQPIRGWTNDPEQMYTLLHFAARYGREDVARMAISEGCSAKDLTFTEKTPAHYATSNGASRGVFDAICSAEGGERTVRDALGEDEWNAYSTSKSWRSGEDLVEVSESFASALTKVALEEAKKKEESKRKREEEEEEEEIFECVICMDKPPDTIVHPCGHCVVCKSCSEKLRGTADKGRCVVCRRSIERIDE